MEHDPPIASETFSEVDHAFMRLALQQAECALQKGEVPVGCVIVHNDVAVASTHNLREETDDPTAHAEILAIRQAALALGSWRLSGTTAYVTLEPCPMCAGALVNARVDRLVFATLDPKAGATTTLYTIGTDVRLNHRFKVEYGLMQDESARLLKDFFADIRKRQREQKQLLRDTALATSPESEHSVPSKTWSET